MMRWTIKTSLKFRYLVVGGAVTFMLFGVIGLGKMPVDVFPEFAPPRVQIQVACLGLTSAEVERLVTTPMEQAFNGIDGLDILRSKSAPQLSALELLFKTGTDEIHARQLVQERMATVQNTLPTWAAPPVMLQPLSATARAMKIGLSSKSMSLEDLSMTAYWKIRARILRVPGVANVAIWGERIKAYQVEIDPGRLESQKVSIDAVMEATAGALDAGLLKFADGNFIGTGGFIDGPNQRMSIRHKGAIVTPDDLAKVPVAQREGRSLRLGDVATLVHEAPPLAGDAIINDGPGLMLVVEKLPWGNTVEVTEGVEKAITSMRPGLKGISIDTTIFRPATFVDEAIHHLTSAMVLGALLVVIVLTFFLLDWRAAFISAVTMPLSLFATIFVLHQMHTTINTMVLAGLVIALGAIVDDAIVDVENVVRRLRVARAEGKEVSTASVILEASIEVRGAVVWASVIEMLALLPIFFLQGLTGSFFKPLALTYALAVFVSTVVAVLCTPALSLVFFSRGSLTKHESPVSGWMQHGFERLLRPIVRRPLPAYGAVAALAVVGLLILPLLGQSLFPEFKERDFLMHWLTKPGTSLAEEQRIVKRGSAAVRAVPGVRNFGSHIGQAMLGEETSGVDFGENWISTDPKYDYDETKGRIEKLVSQYPGMFTNVETYLTERISEVISGESEPLVVRLLGTDLKVLRDKAQEVKRMLGKVKGVDQVNVELQTVIPQIEVDVDLAKAKLYELKPGDVRRAAATMIGGEEVGDIFRDGQTFDVDVWSVPSARNSPEDLGKVPVETPSGQLIKLGDVASVTLRQSPNFIRHEGSVRRLDVGAEVRGRDMGAVARDVDAGLAKIKFPLEHRANVVGVYKERQDAQKRLLLFAAIAAVGVFLILLHALKKPRDVILHIVTLPLALVGGVIGCYLAGATISIGSMVGFFTVLGIVSRNGIMMISHFQHLEEQEGVPFGPELVIRGARERLGPILMTGLASGLALVPLIISGAISGQEIEHPLAVVIVGGLITSALVNLFIVPPLYLRFSRSKSERAALAAAKSEPTPVILLS